MEKDDDNPRKEDPYKVRFHEFVADVRKILLYCENDYPCEDYKVRLSALRLMIRDISVPTRKCNKSCEEFSAKVANDIAEDIDCGETRKQLREVISFLASRSADNAVKSSLWETEAKVLKEAFKLLAENCVHDPKKSCEAYDFAHSLASIFKD